MKLYCKEKDFTLYQGSMLDMLQVITPCSVDSIVTDPPYELNFMGKGWDNSGIAFQKETWEKCYAVLKDGGYLLAFGGSRTFHRIACAIEDAGFEIRDTIMWLYGSGFPKSMNIANSIEGKIINGSANKKDYKYLDGEKGFTSIGYNKSNAADGFRPNNYNGQETIIKVNIKTEEAKKWQGWGTALKPAYEPVIVARKPFKGSLVDNVMKNGVGGINIDECRVGDEKHSVNINDFSNQHGNKFGNGEPIGKLGEKEVTGRFPSNVIFTYDNTDFQEVCGNLPQTNNAGGSIEPKDFSKHKGSMMHFSTQEGEAGRVDTGYVAPKDKGTAARYFYCAKASKKDRDEGLDCFDSFKVRDGRQAHVDKHYQRGETLRKNIHPTVKPTDLMQYLVRLVTPAGGVILDPFNGSGSTGKAAMFENLEKKKGYKYIGIELTEEYLPIAAARIKYIVDQSETIIKEMNEDGQMTIFDFM